MAARKTAAPRKAAARKVAAPAPPAHGEQIEAFEGLRARARASGLTLISPSEPFEVPGFDPPVYARWPKSLIVREELYEATRHLSVFAALRIVLGDDYPRVLAAFDALPDGDELLVGAYMRMLDHFQGPGAADVPGGTPAS